MTTISRRRCASMLQTSHWVILVWFVVSTFSLVIAAQTDALLEDISSLPAVPEHSFQSPFLYGTSVIPYWDYGGSAVASEEMIRLVPAIRSRNGWMWNQVPVQMNNWQIDVDFKIHNTRSPGADGMAIWYTYERAIAGGLYGNTDNFNGMGIVFDTYDNDGMRDNPRVVLITNQPGTPAPRWDVDHDLQENQIASCISYFRNTRNNVKARIRYERSIVTIELDTDGTGDRFQPCLQARNVALKPGGYFGITAATGGLADFHDVFTFLVRDLDEKPGNSPDPATPTPDSPDAAHAFARRRRGLFDPFRDLSHTPSRPAADTLTKDGTPASEKQPDTHGGEENVDQLVARFREQIEKLREDKKKDHQEDAAAPPATNPPTVENPPAQQAPDTATTAPSSTPTASDGISRQSVDELSSIILTAFKNVVDEVKRTDASVQLLTNKVVELSNKQNELQASLNTVKQDLSRQVTSSSESSKTRSDSLKEQVSVLGTKVADVRNQLDALSKVTGHTSQSWKDSANELSQKISREAGWGFWTYFVFFVCILFVVGIIWWRTGPGQREKNLRYLS